MKFTGRLVALFILIMVVAAWHFSYFLIDPAASYYFLIDKGFLIYDFIYVPCLSPIVWWLGKQYDKAKYFSEKDVLTGVYNRRYVLDHFEKRITNKKLCLSVVDVNNFKSINDTYGHDVGDKVLKHISNVLSLRASSKNDIVARIGGDEFLVISEKADTLRSGKLEMELFGDIHLSVSVGVAVYPDDAKSLDELMKVADKNMYYMKPMLKEGSFEPEMRSS